MSIVWRRLNSAWKINTLDSSTAVFSQHLHEATICSKISTFLFSKQRADDFEYYYYSPLLVMLVLLEYHQMIAVDFLKRWFYRANYVQNSATLNWSFTSHFFSSLLGNLNASSNDSDYDNQKFSQVFNANWDDVLVRLVFSDFAYTKPFCMWIVVHPSYLSWFVIDRVQLDRALPVSLLVSHSFTHVLFSSMLSAFVVRLRHNGS